MTFISELTYGLPHYTNVLSYAKVVKGHSLMRQLIKVCNKSTSEALEGEDDPDTVLDHAEEMIFALRSGERNRRAGGPVPYAEVWERYCERQRALAAGKYQPIPFFGLPRLNSITGGGVYENQLVTVAALTSRGKCLSADTRVLMTSGQWKPIKDVREGDWLIATDTTAWRWRTDQVYAVSSGKVRPTYRLTLHGGQVVKATAEHRFLSFKGWRTVAELHAGDFLAIPRRLPEPRGGPSLAPDDAMLLALWIANGAKGQCSYVVSTMSPPLIAELRRVAEERGWNLSLNGGSAWRLAKEKRGTPIQVTEDHPLALLRRAGLAGKKTRNVRVPQAVFQEDNYIVGTFLKYLWSCDGSVSKDKLEYSSNSRGLCLDVKRLLWRFGIRARLSVKKFNYKGRPYVHHRLAVDDVESVRAFASHVGLVGKEDALERLRQAKEKNMIWRGERVPESVRECFKHSGHFYAEHGIHIYRHGGNVMRDKVERIARLDGNTELLARLTRDVGWERIVSIEADGEEMTYDLQMTLHHNFLANGVVSHNSSFLKQMVDYNSAQGVGCIYFSREMEDLAIMGRSIAAETGRDGDASPVPANQVRTAYTLDEYRKGRVERAGQTLARRPVWIETKTANVGEMYQQVRFWLARTGPEWLRRNHPEDWEERLRRFLVVVDYPGLMAGPKAKYNSKAEEMGEVWRFQKDMTQDFNARVVAAAQFSGEGYKGERPRLQHIEWSKEAVKATNVGIVLWTPEREYAEAIRKGRTRYPVGLYIDKQTEGPTGHVEAEYDTQTLEFYPPAPFAAGAGDFNT